MNEYLDHTADVKFRAYGKNLGETFSHVALAITEIIMGTQEIKGKIIEEFSLENKDLKSLLYDYMDHFLYLLDAEQFITRSVETIGIEKKGGIYFLSVILKGDKSSNYQAETHIKAATYAEMEIHEKPGEIMIQVVLDL